MNEREAILLLSRLPTISPSHLLPLKDMGLSISDLVQNPREALEKIEHHRLSFPNVLVGNLDHGSPIKDFGDDQNSRPLRNNFFNQALIQQIEDIKTSFPISKIIDECISKKVDFLTFMDPSYPKFLKEIHKPPLVLYVKGNLIEEDEIAVAIVGSRHASAYGIRISRRMAYELAESGVTIVSGLARGIDGEAHRGALEARGRTIAVLGSGLDVIYPKEHNQLYNQIAESGAVISEFPLGTLPYAYNFPNRNRLIAGLSQGVLVVEAHYRSGSLITASLAMEEGREVYAIPGPLDQPQSNGTHELLKHGAKLVTSADDILEDLRDVFGSIIGFSKETELKNQSETGETIQETKEIELLEAIGKSTFTLDEVKEKTSFDFSEVCAILTQLELTGKIKKQPGGFYEVLVY